METIVISIGGSVIISKYADSSFLKKFASFVIKLSDQYMIYLIRIDFHVQSMALAF